MESEKEEEILKQTQSLTEASKTQLKAYEAFREKIVANIRKRHERISGGEGGINQQHAQHIAYLEKMNKDLSTQHSEAVKHNASLQRDLAVLEKQLHARSYVHELVHLRINC